MLESAQIGNLTSEKLWSAHHDKCAAGVESDLRTPVIILWASCALCLMPKFARVDSSWNKLDKKQKRSEDQVDFGPTPAENGDLLLAFNAYRP